MVNQDRNKLREKSMGSHWESNPRPPTLAVDALTTELRLYPAAIQHSFSVFELEQQANLLSKNEGEGWGN